MLDWSTHCIWLTTVAVVIKKTNISRSIRSRHIPEYQKGALVGVADHRLPDGVLDYKGPLSGTIALNILAEVNKEVKLATTG